MEEQSFEFDVSLAEWMAGWGQQMLDRLIEEGGTGNFAVVAAGDYYIQFTAPWEDAPLYMEAVSNAYLPEKRRLSASGAATLQSMGFAIDAHSRNFAYSSPVTPSIAARITGDVLSDVYGVPSTVMLRVELCLQDAIEAR